MPPTHSPRILLTLGDVAGIGPEIVVGAWPHLLQHAHPIVIGDPGWLERSIRLINAPTRVVVVTHPNEAIPTIDAIPCIVGSTQDLSRVIAGRVCAEAGQAAYDFLCDAIDRTLRGEAEAIVTAPLHKEGLHLAGLKYPGHTEILAERTGTSEFAMVLFGDGLAVAHVTLHMALRDIFRSITLQGIREKIRLLNELVPRLLQRPARLAVAALNPHASDGGLFGDEEARIIRPAIDEARAEGIDVVGPLPADTLFVRAHAGAFDGIIAMYHDEGHIAMKLRSGWRCVNISAGLPIIRTSVAHGTAYDIAGRGIADPASLIAAVEVAARLATTSEEF